MVSQSNGIRKKFIHNTGWIILEKIIQMIIQLLVGLVSVRYLGPKNYGTISYIGSFIALFNSISTLGLGGVVIKHLIDEPEKSGEIVGTSILMRIVSSTISIIGILLMIFVAENGDRNLLFLGILQSASLIFMSFEIIDFWFQSKLNSKYVSITKTIATIVVSIWKIYLLMTSKTLSYFAFSTTLQYIVISILLMYLYYKQDGKIMKVSIERAKYLISESYHFILSGMMVVVYSQMDKIMIGNMIDKEQVGIYTAASNIPSMYSFIFLSIINSARPLILDFRKISYSKYLKSIKQLYSALIWIGIFIAITIFFTRNIMMYLLYGKEYMLGTTVLAISAWSDIFSILGTARGIWVVSENKGKYVKKYLFWGAVINIILNSIFIPKYGINGAAIATLITQITTCIIAPMFYKETRIHTKYIYEATILKWEN